MKRDVTTVTRAVKGVSGETVAYRVSVKWSAGLEDHEPSQTGAEFQSYGMSSAQEGMRCEGCFDTRRSLSEEDLHSGLSLFQG